ncbi:hypothetical protein [Parasitella parasitica]|uniref:Retrotransposon gag domain-containing protein n=1 Tax=Parasitella parasitica TaxID=35722 RepID=A0A0B7NE19_9FUNG|nr:hypothetical protein [Parasitella parasitica]
MPDKKENAAERSTSVRGSSSSSALEEVRTGATARMSKFINRPKLFSGIMTDGGERPNPRAWLRSLDTLRKGMEFRDDEIILVAGSYLVGPANIWWNAVESTINTYNQFVREFTSQFASQAQIDEWWSELECMKQGDNSVDSVKFRLLELFEILGITGENSKIRYFMKVIKPSIAQKIADQGNDTGNWEEVTLAAKRIETSNIKYASKAPQNNVVARNALVTDKMRSVMHDQAGDTRSNDVGSSHPYADGESVQSFSSLSTIMKELCQEMSDLRLSLNTQANATHMPPSPSARPVPICYDCKKPGQISRNYLVETVQLSDGVEVFNVAKRHHAISSNDSKERPRRRRQKTQENRKEPRVVIKVPSSSHPSIPPIGTPEAVAGPSSLLVEPPGPSSMTIDQTNKLRKLRAPPKRLPVYKRTLDTWDKLDSVAAPITFKDWLLNDKNAREQLKQEANEWGE